MAHNILTWIKQRWRLLFVILVPLVLLPLPLVGKTPQAKCGYIVLILTIYWISEVIPLTVTSLLPLILFPMAGILEPEEVAQSYFKDIIALFFGSLALAYAVESVNLHRRVALFVLSLVGTSTKWTMAGLMAVTGFLSMWINNAATASIMLPVVMAITEELDRHGKEYHDKKRAIKEATAAVNEGHQSTTIEILNGGTTKDAFPIEESKKEVVVQVKSGPHLPGRKRTSSKIGEPYEKKYKELKKGFLLGTAYSATIGGLASLVGSATNVFAKGFADSTYRDTAFRINFLNFLLFALPVGLIMLVLCWLWLQLLYNRQEFFQCRADPETSEVQASLKAMLVKQYHDLGKPSWNEYSVAIVFLIMIILWLTKQFGDTPGWELLFREEYISDSTVAVFCGILPLILPNSNPFKSDWKYAPIIQWKDLAKNISWGVIFLFGAGLAIAAAFTSSGLSESVAEALKFLADIPSAAVIITIIVISGLFTQITSNISTVSIFLPVLDSVARSSQIHPGFLILPCTLAVSLAFILPIATPPNAIVFSSGAIRVIDMIKTGIVMNIIGFVVIFLAATTWMPKIYGLDDRATAIFFNINMTTFPTTTTVFLHGGLLSDDDTVGSIQAFGEHGHHRQEENI